MADALKPINRGSLQLYPYRVYKEWTITNSNYRNDYYQISILKGVSPNFNEKIPVSQSINNQVVLDTTELLNSGSTVTLSATPQKIMWSSINQAFYKNRTLHERNLFESASIFSIPFNRLGDGIKPESVIISDSSATASAASTVNLVDRKDTIHNGYLIDSDLNTGSYVPFGDLIGYWGFNEYITPRSITNVKKVVDKSGYLHHAFGKNIEFTRGITTTGSYVRTSGTKATFNGSTSYLRVRHNRQLDFFKNSNFAISLWTDLPVSQSDASADYNWILNKNSVYVDDIEDKKRKVVRRVRNGGIGIYPFDIKVANQNTSNNGKLYVSISDGITTTELTSSTLINDGQHHITFNRSGSSLELYVDGTREASASIAFKGNTWNDRDLMMGSRYVSDTPWDVTSNFNTLSGSLDEVRIYRKGLTSAQITGLADNDYLSGSAYQTDIVGDVFYNTGIMVVSDPRPKYKNVWVGESGSWDYGSSFGWTTKYKSTKELHEVSVLCEVGRGEFNVSTNPSLRINNDIKNPNLEPFVTGSSFNNYITTIGLYTPSGDLVAIGKLGSAIKNRTDADITFRVRFDMDGAFGYPTASLEPKSDPATLKPITSGSVITGYVWNGR